MRVLTLTFVVLLLPLPLVSIGMTENAPLLWWSGLALLIVGGAIPPITRYTFDESEDEEEADGGESEQGPGRKHNNGT